MTSEINNTQNNQPAQGNGHGMSVASLVVGIVAIVFAFIPGLYIIAFVLGVVAIVLGAVGNSQAKKAGLKNGMAVAGLVLGIITIVLALLIQAACSAAIGAASKAVDEAATEVITEATQEEKPAVSTEEEAGLAASTEPAEQAPVSDYAVTIDGVSVGQDYAGEPVVVVTYSWVNNSDEATAAYVSLSEKVFQDGVELPTSYTTDGVDLEASQVDVKPGAGTTYQKAYKLSNTESPVEVEVTEWLDFDDKILASETFEI